MQTNFSYQYRVGSEKGVKYTLPGNVKQKYQQFNNQTKQILQTTQKCPFTSIRQLIITFKLQQNKSTDLQLPDILRQKYEQNSKYFEVDKQFNRYITNIQDIQSKTKNIITCIQQYNKLTDLSRRKVSATNPASSVYKTTQQAAYHEKKLMNSEYLSHESKYFEYLTYSHEFQRALVLICISNIQIFKPHDNLSSSIKSQNFRKFQHSLKQRVDYLSTDYDDLLSLLFDWRESVKNGKPLPSDFQQKRTNAFKKTNQDIEKVKLQYSVLGEFSGWFKADRQELRRTYEQNSNEYKNFLPQYTLAKQQYQMISNQSYYRRLIRQQKDRLQSHLKKNYGMITPYVPTQQFIKTIKCLQKSPVKQIINDQLSPLQQSITYMNIKYQQLYKQACDNIQPTKIRKNIQTYLIKFQNFEKMPNQNNVFAVHLIESCRKLLRIIK